MLKRLLIRMRWPMAALAALLVVAFVLSGWGHTRYYTLSPSIIGPCAVQAGEGELVVQWGDWGVEYRGLMVTEFREDGPKWGWWPAAEIVPPAYVNSPSGWVGIPLWMIALVPTAVALAGFWAKRRQPKPDECAKCRHPLMGAAVCPECGFRCIESGLRA